MLSYKDARCPMPDARCPMLIAYWLKLKRLAKNTGVVLFSYYKILYKLVVFAIQPKKYIYFFLILTFSSLSLNAQDCINTNINNKTSSICGNNCTNVKLTIQNIKNTSNYEVRNIAYKPYYYTTIAGLEYPSIYNPFSFSPVINLPFSFCFYDSVFNKIVSSSNSVLTFDTTNAVLGCSSGYSNSNALPSILGTQCFGNSDGYMPKASIFTVHTALDPRIGPNRPSPPDRKIEFRTEGQAPCRRFIVSYYKIGSLGTNGGIQNCWPDGQSTFQTVLYESTGIIEMYIEKYTCPPLFYSLGRATLGLQNWARDKAVCAPGKNAQVWTAVNEAYQFVPSGGATRFINSKIYTLGGSFIANADTSSNADGTLNLSFANICPSANNTTKFLVKTSFKACPNNDTLIYTDTINLVKNSAITANLIAPISCSGDTSRTLTVNATGDNFMYSLNGGIAQSNNTFLNAPNGNNIINITGTNTGCTASFSTFIGVGNTALQTRNDTAICQGDAVVLNTVSNATSFNWQPSIGLNNTTIKSPIADPTTTTQYIVTATQNNCISKDTVTITVLPKPTVNAGQDVNIVNGYDAQLAGIVQDAVIYVWSPLTFLSNANTLYPAVLKPTTTTLYKLTAIASNGCTASDDVVVNVLPYCVQVKEAFTPNGDGINDVWQVYNNLSCLQNVQVNVYNRYGSLVYNNTNYNNNWDGTYKGKPIPDGTYYYKIIYTFINGTKYNAQGNITILR